jgi:hypothetical protein
MLPRQCDGRKWGWGCSWRRVEKGGAVKSIGPGSRRMGQWDCPSDSSDSCSWRRRRSCWLKQRNGAYSGSPLLQASAHLRSLFHESQEPGRISLTARYHKIQCLPCFGLRTAVVACEAGESGRFDTKGAVVRTGPCGRRGTASTARGTAGRWCHGGT